MDDETWISLKEALYGIGGPGGNGGLYPHVRMRDAKTVFPIQETRISYSGWRIVFVRRIDVEAVRARVDSTV